MAEYRSGIRRLSAAAIVVAACLADPQEAAPQDDAVDLVAHRAVYDLKLSLSRGKRPIESVRGRILYDFAGSSCEGYALQFRQVSEIDTGEGKTLTSDLRATTWEEGSAQSFRFNSQNFINQKLDNDVDGKAERHDSAVSVNLTKPGAKKVDIEGSSIFPTDHMRRIIKAARASKTILELPVFDGSESGEKVYDTLSVIGQPIAPDAKKLEDAAGRSDVLSRLQRWPVTISYFDKSKKGGEQTPIYSIRFELYENGVSRALALDYVDFVVSGEMTSLELKNSKPCK